MKIFDVIIFFFFSTLRTIQQKTVKTTYLRPLGARKLAEGKALLECFGSFFSERWQSTMFQIFPSTRVSFLKYTEVLM